MVPPFPSPITQRRLIVKPELHSYSNIYIIANKKIHEIN